MCKELLLHKARTLKARGNGQIIYGVWLEERKATGRCFKRLQWPERRIRSKQNHKSYAECVKFGW